VERRRQNRALNHGSATLVVDDHLNSSATLTMAKTSVRSRWHRRQRHRPTPTSALHGRKTARAWRTISADNGYSETIPIVLPVGILGTQTFNGRGRSRP
jgi:hypothetical protein